MKCQKCRQPFIVCCGELLCPICRGEPEFVTVTVAHEDAPAFALELMKDKPREVLTKIEGKPRRAPVGGKEYVMVWGEE